MGAKISVTERETRCKKEENKMRHRRGRRERRLKSAWTEKIKFKRGKEKKIWSRERGQSDAGEGK